MSNPMKEFLTFQKAHNYRWKLFIRTNSPYIYIRDSFKGDERNSLKPLRKDVQGDCQKAWQLVQQLKDSGYEETVQLNQPNTKSSFWVDEFDSFKEFLKSKNKGSTNKDYLSLWKNLIKNKIPTTSKGIFAWLKDKTYGTSAFQKRLDFLRQVQLYIRKKDGVFPHWFVYEDYLTQRGMHNEYRKTSMSKKKKKEKYPPRAIVSKQSMEKYLDENMKDFPWQCWCLAMMMNYGLRNHELWYMKPMNNLFLLVPGRLTKANEDHIVWPAFADWDKKYHLFRDFAKYQTFLRNKSRPEIVSATRTDVSYEVEDEAAYENGVGMKNDKLGEFITRNTLGASFRTTNQRGRKLRTTAMPSLNAISTDGSKKILDALPYDLRHTWAITMHTDPAFSHIPMEKCAEAMGHGLEVHKDKYLLWTDTGKVAEQFIDGWEHPYAA